MTSIVLDGAAIQNRADALDAFAPYFPDYYGRNLDALWDCLTDFSEPAEIRVVNLETLQETLGPFWPRLQQVLKRAAAENPSVSVVMEQGI